MDWTSRPEDITPDQEPPDHHPHADDDPRDIDDDFWDRPILAEEDLAPFDFDGPESDATDDFSPEYADDVVMSFSPDGIQATDDDDTSETQDWTQTPAVATFEYPEEPAMSDAPIDPFEPVIESVDEAFTESVAE